MFSGNNFLAKALARLLRIACVDLSSTVDDLNRPIYKIGRSPYKLECPAYKSTYIFGGLKRILYTNLRPYGLDKLKLGGPNG